MSRLLNADNLVKLLAGLLLAMLTYQGKCLCDRVSAVEATQIRICVWLGIEPVVQSSTPKGVLQKEYSKGCTPKVVLPKAYSYRGTPIVVDAAGKNRRNQKSDASTRIIGFFPLDIRRGDCLRWDP